MGTKGWYVRGLKNHRILGVDDYSWIIFIMCKQNKAQICHGMYSSAFKRANSIKLKIIMSHVDLEKELRLFELKFWIIGGCVRILC